MNMSGSFGEAFAGARPVAQHCRELTERGPRPEERAEHVAAWRRDLGAELALELGQLFSGGKLGVSVTGPEMLGGQDVFDKIGPMASNSLLRCGEGDQTLLLSLDFGTAVALTDTSFGGTGDIPDTPPDQLPRSAAMLIEKLAGMVAQVIVMTNGSADRAKGDVLVRSDSVTRLKPFKEDAQVALFTLNLTMGAFSEWNALLAVTEDKLDALLPGMDASKMSKRAPGFPGFAAQDAFAAMPLPLEAVLGEFDLSLGKLERLAPGDEIPLAIPRELALCSGQEVLAHGTLGTVENRMALRLTRMRGQDQKANPHFTDRAAPQAAPQGVSA